MSDDFEDSMEDDFEDEDNTYPIKTKSIAQYASEQGDEIPESDREFMFRLIEPDVPYPQIRRDIGLSKMKQNEIDLCEIYFEIARRSRHMADTASKKNQKDVSAAFLRLEHNYIEKIYERIDIRRSRDGFQWEALNRRIKELRKTSDQKKKGWMQKQNENE